MNAYKKFIYEGFHSNQLIAVSHLNPSVTFCDFVVSFILLIWLLDTRVFWS